MTWKLYFWGFNVSTKLGTFKKTYIQGILFYRVTYDTKIMKQLKCPKTVGVT